MGRKISSSQDVVIVKANKDSKDKKDRKKRFIQYILTIEHANNVDN